MKSLSRLSSTASTVSVHCVHRRLAPVLQRYRYDIHGNAMMLDPAGNEIGVDPSSPRH
ncbi:MAG: hypothetical protein RBU25_17675 [Lentisphaeria bacterium]|jgi:hypothetical protein|nr:hypothetical protein [Lentisphaeria bacterium]